MKTYDVYLLASPTRTLYLGVTSDLRRRLEQHKARAVPAFTFEHHVPLLLQYETTADGTAHIAREQQIKDRLRVRWR